VIRRVDDCAIRTNASETQRDSQCECDSTVDECESDAKDLTLTFARFALMRVRRNGICNESDFAQIQRLTRETKDPGIGCKECFGHKWKK
jgi:hypothetical protein